MTGYHLASFLGAWLMRAGQLSLGVASGGHILSLRHIPLYRALNSILALILSRVIRQILSFLFVSMSTLDFSDLRRSVFPQKDAVWVCNGQCGTGRIRDSGSLLLHADSPGLQTLYWVPSGICIIAVLG